MRSKTASQIGRVTTTGSFSEYATPTSNASPGAVTATVDPNYPIWFTESAAGNLGLVNVGGFITELRVRKPAGAQPFGIVPGPAGEQAIWFTDLQSGNAIGRVNNQGHERAFALPQSGEQPATIVDGPDGALWFTEQKSGKIGRISIAGKIREYAIPHGAHAEPFGIAAGADGALWFALAGSNRIGRIDTAGNTDLPGADGEVRAVVDRARAGLRAVVHRSRRQQRRQDRPVDGCRYRVSDSDGRQLPRGHRSRSRRRHVVHGELHRQGRAG